MKAPDPHADQPILQHGPEVAEARLVIIAVHGRGASARDILALAAQVAPTDVACLAPQAAGSSWYPYSFLAPIERNEPALSSALGRIGSLLEEVASDRVPPERVVLLGFSQGGCLSLEFAARHPRRYAAAVALSAGLIGPPGTSREYPGSFEGTPVLLGCSDVDEHIPVERVRESADVFRRMGASVDERIYPDMGHAVNQDEIEAVNGLLTA